MDDTEYTIVELARRGGIAPLTVRQWIKRGLLPRARFAGPKTRYSDVHLLRIKAIKRFKGDGLSLNSITMRLAKMSPQDIQNLVQPPVVAPPPPEPTFPSENWKRLVLCPGLELHVADTPMHKRMAQQVYDDYIARLRG